MATVAKRPAQLPSQQTEPALRRVPQSYHDGKSPAAWFGAMVALAGFVVGSAGFLMMNVPIIIAAGVIILIALVGTVLLRSFGFGEAVGYDGRLRGEDAARRGLP